MMKFSSNTAVQLSEEKPALWCLLLGKLLQLKLHFKSVNSLHQANTWRPAAADSCLWAQSAEGQDPLSVWLRRGEGRERAGRGGCVCFDFTRDLCPLIHKPLIPWQASWSCCDTFPQPRASMGPHPSFPSISFCLHCCALRPANVSHPDDIAAKTDQAAPPAHTHPPPRVSNKEGGWSWCCSADFCLFPMAPTNVKAARGRVFASVFPSLCHRHLEQHQAHHRHSLSICGAQGNFLLHLHLPGRYENWTLCFMTTIKHQNLPGLTEDFSWLLNGKLVLTHPMQIMDWFRFIQNRTDWFP